MVQGWVRSSPRVGSWPLAFVIFINDLDDCIKQLTIVNKFADDTKLGQRIESDQDRETLQSCIDNLLIWAEDWCMEFNVKKCKVMHVGRNNPNCEYIMTMMILQTVSKERDIWLVVNQDLKPSLQCAEASRRASTVLGQITKTFLYRDRFTFLRLYTQFCGPGVVTLDWTGYWSIRESAAQGGQHDRWFKRQDLWGKAWWSWFIVPEGQKNQTRPDPNLQNFEGNKQSRSRHLVQ